MQTPLPSVSLVIASYNEGSHLERTVASLLAHTLHPDYRIILIDDGSSDDSFHFLQRAMDRQDTRFRHHRFETSVGCIEARHQGATLADSDLLVFLDAHMSFPSGWLIALCNTHARWGTGSVITPSVTTLDATTWQPNATQSEVLTINERFDLIWRKPHYPTGLLATPGGCCVMLDRSFYTAVGGFDRGLRRWGCEFIDLILKVYAAGGACYLEPTVLVGHLFRKAFSYPMHHRDLVYNKLRVGYIHLSDASFHRLHEALRGTPGFTEGLALFSADQADLEEHRQRHRTTNLRAADWFVRMFLPGLCDTELARLLDEQPAVASAKPLSSRSVSPQQKGPTMTPISQATMVQYARLLKTAKDHAALKPDLIQSLHARFRAVDGDGQTWTVGLNDFVWHRLDQGRWMRAEPSPDLSIEDGTWLALQTLDQLPSIPEPPPSPAFITVEPAAVEALARQFQAALDAHRLSPAEGKALHARFRAYGPDGTPWTVGLRSLRWHVLKEESWTAGVPPTRLRLDATLHERLSLLAAPPPSPMPTETEDPGSIAEAPFTPSLDTPPPDQAPSKKEPDAASPPSSRSAKRKKTALFVGSGIVLLIASLFFLYPYHQRHWVPPNLDESTRFGWSPDSQHLAFAGLDADYFQRLYSINVDDGRFQILDERAGGHADWSPDGEWIAYSDYQQLHLIRPADGTKLLVEGAEYYQAPPAWSPDGSWVAYWAKTAPQDYSLRLAQADEEGLQIQTRYSVNAYLPVSSAPIVWSRNGQYLSLALQRLEDNVSEIIIINAQDGDFVGRVIGQNYKLDPPSWSLDDRWIYFSAYNSTKGSVYRATPQGTSITELIVEESPLTSASLSPDGMHLAYLAGFNPRELRVLAIQEGTTQTIDTGLEASFYSPIIWSPDSQYAALLVKDPNTRNYILRHNIAVVDLLGNHRILLK